MKKLGITLCTLTFLGALAVPVLASGGEHGAHFDVPQFVAGIINFAIFIYLVIRFGGKGISSYYKSRAETQMVAVREAEKLLGEAQKIFDEVTKRKDNLEQETLQMVEGAKRRVQEQSEEILVGAKAQAERIVEDAKRTIDGEIGQATNRLRAQLVEHALKVAESSIDQSLDDDGQKQLVEHFMSKMEDLH